MATMVKEKDRQKKKNKQKNVVKTSVNEEQPRISVNVPRESISAEEADTSENTNIEETCTENLTTSSIDLDSRLVVTNTAEEEASISHTELSYTITSEVPCVSLSENYETMVKIKARELELCRLNAELMASMKMSDYNDTQDLEIKEDDQQKSVQPSIEDTIPSAPMFEEKLQVQEPHRTVEEKEIKVKTPCMPIEEAIRIYGGSEMSAVKALSEKEEVLVEAGPVSGPEHPLVDLLSTFRSSLRALDNERSKLACSVADEEKYRSTLWQVNKRDIHKEAECKCGNTVPLTATYKHATYLTERLPVAKLRLESILRDVQDSYCHHQHTALLTHYQIEEFISETIQSNKPAIREALSLILQALRISDNVLQAAALQRWAAALVAALVDQRDVRQILFVVHHLFRQSRSVVWAARVLHPGPGTPTTLAVLDTLLAGARRDTATECTEDMEEAWEEVSSSGVSGAVSEDCLRETDLLALFHVFPIRDIIANIVKIRCTDFSKTPPQSWGDMSGGRDVIAACSGARTLLLTLHRAAHAHAHYNRLHETLRRVAAAMLDALDCFYRTPRAPYTLELHDQITVELEACFTSAFVMFGARDLDKLNTAILSDHTAKDYCFTFILGLHDTSPKRIASLSVDAPELSCGARVRVVSCAAACRPGDPDLPTIVLDFLLQTGIKSKSPACSGGCRTEARACLPTLVAAHGYLHTTALYNVAEIAKVESLDASVVRTLSVKSWRPQPDELFSLLNEWARRCPTLLPDLLMEIDCTPYTGISHGAQLALLNYIVQWAGPVEARWRALRRLRTHPVCWNMSSPCIDGPETPPGDVFECARALLATHWGASVPLICSYGVSSLLTLLSRPREAVHCLAPLMIVMAQSPESISLTPKFAEVFSGLLNSGPSLVQRALGRGGAAGAELLLRLALAQIETQPCGIPKSYMLSAWLHALSRGGAAPVLDAVCAASGDWATVDAHASLLLQEENAKDHISTAVRYASTAPLLCESMLRAHYTQREFNTGTFAAVSNVLYRQQINAQKIHVDNALQKIKASISSEELTIYRCASAAAVSPLQHPAHLTLWRLFLHLYLQRPPDNMHESAMPVGPLFFSGIKKSRTLSQIKKRLQETAAHHHNEIENYKKLLGESIRESNRVERSESICKDAGLLPELSIKDFTGASDSDLDSSEGEVENYEEIRDDGTENERQRILDMTRYHSGAERMLSEYIVWLDEGDKVRASPHHADIARFIPEQALEAAWKDLVSRSRPPPSELDDFPHPLPPPIQPIQTDNTPLKQAVDAICGIKDKSGIRSRRMIKSPLGEVDFKDTRQLLLAVDKHLTDIDLLAIEWCKETSFISTLDTKLWELTASLRVCRVLPAVTKLCAHTRDGKRCPHTVTFYFNEREWCISSGVERGIKENRSSWVSGVRRLARPRPLAARTAAAILSIASRIEDSGVARCVLERAFNHAKVDACVAANNTITAFVELLAQRQLRHNGEACAALLSRWSWQQTSSLQQALCGTLVSPHRVHSLHWPLLYNAVLNAKLPAHTTFSYLSKFDMSTWSRTASPTARHQLLSSLVDAQQKQSNDANISVLYELLGVHTSILIDAKELCDVVMKFNVSRVPVGQWTHLIRAVDENAKNVDFDQLGHLLRELGTLWWKVRSSARSTSVECYAPPVAKLLRALLRAFVAAGVALSYSPERVGYNTWSAVVESWGPWITPHSSPLLPSLGVDSSQYTDMVTQFVECLRELMGYCPEMQAPLVHEIFRWSAHAHAHAQAAPEGRVQAAELLHALLVLPWKLLTFNTASLDTITQISVSNDKEIQSWCAAVLRDVRVESMLCDVTGVTSPHRLTQLLHLFTGTEMNHSLELLEQATLLPWRQLPEPVLAEALERLFLVHYNTTVPYHDIPQFRVLLFASELLVNSPERIVSVTSRTKRTRAVSQWTRAASVPTVHNHVASHCTAMLRTITDIAPYLDKSSGELEELLTRASVIMCIEPAASVALPVWLQYVQNSSGHMTGACISAACSLTTPLHAATLADAAIKRHIMINESGWTEAVERWRSSSPWSSPHTLMSHSCAHAAYVCAHAHTRAARTPLLFIALQQATIHFVEEEAIVALWICYACRVALECLSATSDDATRDATIGATSDDATRDATIGATSENEETAHAARTLIANWAQTPRRSLLKVVTLQSDTDHTTPQHRLLCRLAECILSPSKESIQNFTNALTSVGSHSDVITWGTNAQPSLLPRLAVRLYPRYERYFRIEMEATSAK